MIEGRELEAREPRVLGKTASSMHGPAPSRACKVYAAAHGPVPAVSSNSLPEYAARNRAAAQSWLQLGNGVAWQWIEL